MADEFTLMHHPEIGEHLAPSNPRVLARFEKKGWVIGPAPDAEKERKADEVAQKKAEAAAAKAAADENKGA